jgi:hypothetical protein
LDVRGEVAGIHVCHAGDEGRSQEWQQPSEPAFLASSGKDGARSLLGLCRWLLRGAPSARVSIPSYFEILSVARSERHPMRGRKRPVRLM